MGRHPGYCTCKRCSDELNRSYNRAMKQRGGGGRSQRNNGGWTPRQTGTMDDDSVVTFKQGTGDNEGHTLIADGTPSGQAFDRKKEHNHYGLKREEDGGHFSEDRGYYTGPDH